MNTTIGGPELKAMAAMALLALVLLVSVTLAVWTASTTTGGGADEPAMVRAASAGGSSIARDPDIERHAEVVASYHEGSLR